MVQLKMGHIAWARLHICNANENMCNSENVFNDFKTKQFPCS